MGQFQDYQLQLAHWTFGIEIILAAPQGNSLPETQRPFEKPTIPELLSSPLLNSRLFAEVQGNIRAENDGQKLLYHQTGYFDNKRSEVERLRSLFNLLSRLATDYRRFLSWGGETILAVQSQGKKLNPLTRQLIHNIGEETTRRLGERTAFMLCSTCLLRCRPYKVNLLELLDFETIVYYGCRNCRQSWDFIECQKLIAVLDNALEAERVLHEDVLRVNWSVRRRLFDFDHVEIISATDEEIERFAVQVGNSTDPVQKSTYRKMTCIVAPTCDLSKGSQRILNRLFGNVKRPD